MEENKIDLNDVIKSGISLVNFSATWCGPCKVMSPIMEELKKELTDYNILKLDVEKYTEEGTKCGVRSIPTFIVYQNGEEKERWVGTKSKLDIKEILFKYNNL